MPAASAETERGGALKLGATFEARRFQPAWPRRRVGLGGRRGAAYFLRGRADGLRDGRHFRLGVSRQSPAPALQAGQRPASPAGFSKGHVALWTASRGAHPRRGPGNPAAFAPPFGQPARAGCCTGGHARLAHPGTGSCPPSVPAGGRFRPRGAEPGGWERL